MTRYIDADELLEWIESKKEKSLSFKQVHYEIIKNKINEFTITDTSEWWNGYKVTGEIDDPDTRGHYDDALEEFVIKHKEEIIKTLPKPE